MNESISDVVSQLRFQSGPVETLYLNEVRVRERFIAHLGAVEDVVRSATREAGGEIALPLKIGGKVGGETSVTWTLSDPVAQVLVLRTALEERGEITGADRPEPGTYVVRSGLALLSRPGAFSVGRPVDPPELLAALEQERQHQEGWLRAMQGPEAKMWLLAVSDGPSVSAAVLDNQWLRPGLPSYLGGAVPWEIFGTLRSYIEDVPLLALLHIRVLW